MNIPDHIAAVAIARQPEVLVTWTILAQLVGRLVIIIFVLSFHTSLGGDYL